LFCIACYLLIITLNRHRFSQPTGFLFVILPSLYAVVSIYLFGWDIGAQWFLMALIIPVFIMYEKFPRGIRRLYVIFFFAMMLLCLYIPTQFEPNYAGSWVYVMNIVNISLAMFSGVLSAEIINFSSMFNQRRYQSKIANLSDEANRDPLTKMWNRRYIENVLTNLFWEDIAKRERTFIAAIDIDHFKEINETYGHEIGDDVLKQFAQVMLKGFRSADVTSRWGRETFVVILNDTEEKGVLKALENFKGKMQYAGFSAGDEKLDIKVTTGLVCCNASDNYIDCINKIMNYSEVAGAKS